MDKEALKIAVDIAKTKLAFFSAVAGGVWIKIDLDPTLLNAILVVVFLASLIGVLKNLFLVGEYEKELKDGPVSKS